MSEKKLKPRKKRRCACGHSYWCHRCDCWVPDGWLCQHLYPKGAKKPKCVVGFQGPILASQDRPGTR